jgi:hypothetical protein
MIQAANLVMKIEFVLKSSPPRGKRKQLLGKGDMKVLNCKRRIIILSGSYQLSHPVN